ncbi:TRAP dicarboxylate transporter subunit DctM [Alcanivorax hongdengensis A-11-3]|uniref:TRAP dicarboxylate transporter subunit DctM n=1 Tax=Alcanivorax hongdengensis A-11-3 TaxID=1177179 RepID=L0WBP4_9GAMM|nr:sterol desaturase family protein [Alcanivorax hongdengensis]EKF73512.1 TRAP dicarboxylate transporter subunit DctM [Alcanivorax hongdengensis A-11-3]
MKTLHWIVSRGFTLFFLGLSIIAVVALGYDSHTLMLWFLLPFYGISLLAQTLMPKVKKPLENGELTTDLVSNGVLMVINSLQNAVLSAVFALGSSSLLIQLGWLDPHYGLSNAPLWLQVLVGIMLLDLFFYITHRMAHEIPFLWRFHSVHHCAHRVTFMNAYRAHPLDAMFRRFVPLFFVLLTGISEQALVATAVIGSVLATITHLNMDLKHGWLNYLIGTNEVHRWHHSSRYDEAKNFAVIMLWDHLFGTFYYPRDRDMPEHIGLVNERHFPLHHYGKQLLIPFRWRRLKRRQAGIQRIEKPSDMITGNR